MVKLPLPIAVNATGGRRVASRGWGAAALRLGAAMRLPPRLSASLRHSVPESLVPDREIRDPVLKGLPRKMPQIPLNSPGFSFASREAGHACPDTHRVLAPNRQHDDVGGPPAQAGVPCIVQSRINSLTS